MKPPIPTVPRLQRAAWNEPRQQFGKAASDWLTTENHPGPLISCLAVVRVIRRPYDPHQFAVIEPVQLARVAVVDDDIAGTVVEVRVHLVMAMGTVDPSLEIVPVGSGGDQGAGIASSQFFDERDEDAHWNEHATAPGAVSDADLGNGRMHERFSTD